MTVQEMIKKLGEFEPDAEVVILGEMSGNPMEVSEICPNQDPDADVGNPNDVWIMLMEED